MTVHWDSIRPQVTLLSETPYFSTQFNIGPGTVYVIFSEPVFGFTAAGLTVVNALISNFHAVYNATNAPSLTAATVVNLEARRRRRSQCFRCVYAFDVTPAIPPELVYQRARVRYGSR